MIRILLTLLAGLAIASSAWAQNSSTGSFKAADGSSVTVSASTISGLGTQTLVLTGSASVKSVNSGTKTNFEAEGKKMTVVFFQKPGAKAAAPGVGAIKSADITGSVKMVSSMIDPATGARTTTTITGDKATYDGPTQMAHVTGNVKMVSDNPAMFQSLAVMTGDKAATGVRTTTTITGDKATYDGLTQMAYVTGNVKMISDNPTMFQSPAVMTGDKATINLKPNIGPDDARFSIESSPGLSRIEVTPSESALRAIKQKAQDKK